MGTQQALLVCGTGGEERDAKIGSEERRRTCACDLAAERTLRGAGVAERSVWETGGVQPHV